MIYIGFKKDSRENNFAEKTTILQSQRIKVKNLKKIKLTKTGILKLNSTVEFLCSKKKTKVPISNKKDLETIRLF